MTGARARRGPVGDPSLDDAGSLPAPELLAAEIVEDLQAALEEFAAIAGTLQQARGGVTGEGGAAAGE